MNRVIRRIAGNLLVIAGIVNSFCALLMTPLYLAAFATFMRGLYSKGGSGPPVGASSDEVPAVLMFLGVGHWLLTVVFIGLGVFFASNVRAGDKG